jgi:5'(3')-deoxyribonucleotidase
MRGLRDWTIFIDLDEVLADFIGAACRVHGINRGLMDSCRTQWSIIPAIRRDMTIDQFWDPISQLGKQFWIDLEPLPWISELMNLIGKYKCSWHVLSAPSSHCEESYDGKRKWLQNHFGKNFDRFLLTPHKHLVSKPGTLLIDDRPDNVQRFYYNELGTCMTGGQGIIFPTTGMKGAYGDGLNIWIPKPVEYLETMFELYERDIINGRKFG